MPLTSGARLGPFAVVSPLGVGGMGEVYRARDTRLGRDVAIKILPESFATDPDRRARFEREAQLLAALNHPNIAQIHGFEESSDVRALVMELVEGPTLADRIATGPVAIDETLPLARQIAEALEAAHAQGIVHRDLKPANIKVRRDGTVKVLDFGLAKVTAADAGSERAGLSPATVTSPAMTAAGIILGTAAYMAPEQARGTSVDERADIWAFGAVLFEMVTGQRAFEGQLTSDVLASVLKSEPQWQTLPGDTPPALRQLLRRCLEKDPRRRLQAIGDARIEIDDLISGVSQPAPATLRQVVSPQSRAVPWTLAAFAVTLAVAMLWLWAPWQETAAGPSVRIRADLGADVDLVIANTGSAAILSPDGSMLAFVGQRAPSEPSQLFIRRFSQLDASPLPGTDGAVNPFFSPDGQWIAFFDATRLKKIAVTGGAPVTLCDAPNSRGGTWASDGMIVFAENRSGLWRVAAAGGAREALTTLGDGELTHRHPQVLPGGKALLYTAHTAGNNFDDAYLVVQPLPTGPRSVIEKNGYYGRYLPSGHVVYVRERTLFAVPFDADRLVSTGSPVPVIEGVAVSDGRGEAQFALSDEGTLVYSPAQSGTGTVPVFWMNRAGQTSLLRSTPATWSSPRFAPDGQRLAMTIADGPQTDIWINDLVRGAMTRFTFEPTVDSNPVWTPDGQRIAFASVRGNDKLPNVYWQRADGSGEPQRLTNDDSALQVPSSWHPSGRFLAFTRAAGGGTTDLMILPMEGSEAAGWKPGLPTPFLSTRFRESEPKFSPDGRWIAYESAEGGALQVYVRPFPGPGGKWQVSTGGGEEPRWLPSRAELLFQNPDGQVMVASYTTSGDSFRPERPRPWAPVRFSNLGRGFDVHPDGDRLAVPPIAQLEDAQRRDQVVLIFNFFGEVKRATANK